MRVRIRLFQPLDGNVRINLRGRKAGVAEQRLDAAQIGAAIEQVRRETMAQLVWTDRNRNRRVA